MSTDNTQEVLEIIECIEDDAEYLSDWEKNFIADLKSKGGPFTQAQHDKVVQIHEWRVKDEPTYDTEIY